LIAARGPEYRSKLYRLGGVKHFKCLQGRDEV
jgi:hypothetical protein